MGFDERSGKNFDHRKRWSEEELKLLAANFEIDLLAFACLANHFHLLLRSRPDVVETWDDTQVALRWWQLCPTRKVKREVNADIVSKGYRKSSLRTKCGVPLFPPLLHRID